MCVVNWKYASAEDVKTIQDKLIVSINSENVEPQIICRPDIQVIGERRLVRNNDIHEVCYLSENGGPQRDISETEVGKRWIRNNQTPLLIWNLF